MLADEFTEGYCGSILHETTCRGAAHQNGKQECFWRT
jgi:hypothetical protein